MFIRYHRNIDRSIASAKPILNLQSPISSGILRLSMIKFAKTMPRSYELKIRLISLVLVGAFLLQEVSYSAPAMSGSAGIVPLDPTRFEAPLQFSALKEIHRGSNGTFIIHIQDAHSNLSGQENLAKTLDTIMSQYGVSLVLVEGSSKEATLDPLKELAPSKEVCRRVARSFLVQGKIAGEEYLNLVSDRPMKIMGIEDGALYRQSIESYSRLADKREAILQYLKKIENALEKLKQRHYPKELLNYEKSAKEKKLGFEADFKALLKLTEEKSVDLKDLSHIQKLILLQEKERQIDFTQANLEQATLVEKISQRGGQENLESFLKELSQAKNQKVSQFTFFQKTFNIAKEKGISLDEYSNLMLYGDYLRQFSELDLDQVLDELTKAENRIYASLLLTQDARLVHSIDRYLKLLDKAYRIQMSTQEFKLFQANEPDFATVSTLAFINRKLADLGYFEDLLPYIGFLEDGKQALTAFYDSVDKRDIAFVQNTERILTQENQKVAVLISGGYHTPHLKKLFQDQGYSYAVLTPIVTQPTNQQKYEKLLLAPIRKEIKKIELTQGESRVNGKSLSDMEKNLIRAKKTEGARVAAVATDSIRLTEFIEHGFGISGSRLSDTIEKFEGRPDNPTSGARATPPPSAAGKKEKKEGKSQVFAVGQGNKSRQSAAGTRLVGKQLWSRLVYSICRWVAVTSREKANAAFDVAVQTKTLGSLKKALVSAQNEYKWWRRAEKYGPISDRAPNPDTHIALSRFRKLYDLVKLGFQKEDLDDVKRRLTQANGAAHKNNPGELTLVKDYFHENRRQRPYYIAAIYFEKEYETFEENFRRATKQYEDTNVREAYKDEIKWVTEWMEENSVDRGLVVEVLRYCQDETLIPGLSVNKPRSLSDPSVLIKFKSVKDNIFNHVSEARLFDAFAYLINHFSSAGPGARMAEDRIIASIRKGLLRDTLNVLQDFLEGKSTNLGDNSVIKGDLESIFGGSIKEIELSLSSLSKKRRWLGLKKSDWNKVWDAIDTATPRPSTISSFFPDHGFTDRPVGRDGGPSAARMAAVPNEQAQLFQTIKAELLECADSVFKDEYFQSIRFSFYMPSSDIKPSQYDFFWIIVTRKTIEAEKKPQAHRPCIER